MVLSCMVSIVTVPFVTLIRQRLILVFVPIMVCTSE